jgi:hypothetical protein
MAADSTSIGETRIAGLSRLCPPSKLLGNTVDEAFATERQ